MIAFQKEFLLLKVAGRPKKIRTIVSDLLINKKPARAGFLLII
jgi:hypothetical protein